MSDEDVSEVQPAPIRLPGVQVRAATGASAKKLRELAEERAPDPSVFEQHEPFFWRATASNGKLDSYSTIMMPSTLENYAEDAERGVPFLDSHKRDGTIRNFGRSLDATYIKSGGARVEIDFFAMQGLPGAKGGAVDAFIAEARGGTAHDVSVGFHGGRMICNICSRDMNEMDWEDWDNNCFHWPGRWYTKDGKKAKEGDKGAIRCIAQIEEARLMEVSTVDTGATPDAAIIGVKIGPMAERGLVSREMIEAVQRQFGNRIKVPEIPRIYAPGVRRAGQRGEARGMADERNQDDVEQRLRAAEVERDGALRHLQGIAVRVLPQGSQVPEAAGELAAAILPPLDELRALAKQGEEARQLLIADAMVECVRAFGDTKPGGKEFDKARYERTLARCDDLAMIREYLETWRTIGDARNPSGRATVDADETVPETVPQQQQAIPVASWRAYRAG